MLQDMWNIFPESSMDHSASDSRKSLMKARPEELQDYFAWVKDALDSMTRSEERRWRNLFQGNLRGFVDYQLTLSKDIPDAKRVAHFRENVLSRQVGGNVRAVVAKYYRNFNRLAFALISWSIRNGKQYPWISASTGEVRVLQFQKGIGKGSWRHPLIVNYSLGEKGFDLTSEEGREAFERVVQTLAEKGIVGDGEGNNLVLSSDNEVRKKISGYFWQDCEVAQQTMEWELKAQFGRLRPGLLHNLAIIVSLIREIGILTDNHGLGSKGFLEKDNIERLFERFSNLGLVLVEEREEHLRIMRSDSMSAFLSRGGSIISSANSNIILAGALLSSFSVPCEKVISWVWELCEQADSSPPRFTAHSLERTFVERLSAMGFGYYAVRPNSRPAGCLARIYLNNFKRGIFPLDSLYGLLLIGDAPALAEVSEMDGLEEFQAAFNQLWSAYVKTVNESSTGQTLDERGTTRQATPQIGYQGWVSFLHSRGAHEEAGYTALAGLLARTGHGRFLRFLRRMVNFYEDHWRMGSELRWILKESVSRS